MLLRLYYYNYPSVLALLTDFLAVLMEVSEGAMRMPKRSQSVSCNKEEPSDQLESSK